MFVAYALVMLLSMLIFGCISVANLENTSCGGPNPGGQNKIWVISKHDVQSIPAPGAGTHIISANIVLKPGKAWALWDFAIDTGSLSSEAVGDQGSQSCKVTVGVYIPRSKPAIDKVISDCYNGEFIVIVEDGLGQRKIGGTTSRGLMFKSVYNSGKKYDEKNGREVGFEGGQANEPYFYSGAIVELGAPVTPPPVTPPTT